MKIKWTFLAVLPAIFLLFACQDGNNDKSNNDHEQTQETEETTDTQDAPAEETVETFVSEKYGFSVDFLEEPIEETQEVPTLAGDLEMITYMHDAGDHVYFVAISDMPEEMIAEADTAEMLEGGIDGMLEQFSDSEILEREKINMNDYPGRVIEATGTTSGMQVYNKAHIYMVDNSLYQVYVLCEQSKADKEKINGFINSFQMLEKEEK